MERVAAVVGERPILLSELRLRAKPHLERLARSAPTPAEQAAAESAIYRDLLDRMIDERLVESAADKAHLTVTQDEIDRALDAVAAENRMSRRSVLDDAQRQGLTEAEYRDELRRQLLEGKLVQLRVRDRVHVTEHDARVAYAHWEKEHAAAHLVDVRILPLTVPAGASARFSAAQHALAQQIADRARSGESFCQLVRTYTGTSSCGSFGEMPLEALLPELRDAAQSLRPGGTSDPIDLYDALGNTSVLVIHLGPTPTLPPFELVEKEMIERARIEATERQRRLWLQEVRRGVYVDLRL